LRPAALERLGAHALHEGLDFEWGGWSQLQVLLGCLAHVKRQLDPDWLLVLSGQDYPLRQMAEIESDLAEGDHDALLGNAWQLDTGRVPEPPAREFFLRYAYRHFAVPASAPRLPGGIRPLAYTRELPPRIGIRRRSLPFGDGFGCYVSADWLTLNRKAVEAVLRAARERPGLMHYYRRAAIPSESLFATVLLNDESLRVARDNRRFASFPAPNAPHPNTLTTSDLDRMLASGCDFARKFDIEADAEVLDLLDEQRRSRSPR
jgi:hypothetical protein